MKKKYDINDVINLREKEKLTWKEIGITLGVSGDVLRKAYCRETNRTNPGPINYKYQKNRRLSRKLLLIESLGGCCSKCGYKENISALEFHHTNPEKKSFNINSSFLGSLSFDKVVEESKKCILLCSNCHREYHNPELSLNTVKDQLLSTRDDSKKTPKTYKSVCPVCGKSFKKITGKIYCSKECRETQKNYPPIDVLEKSYSKLKSWTKVAKEFGISRKIIHRIRKNSGKD